MSNEERERKKQIALRNRQTRRNQKQANNLAELFKGSTFVRPEPRVDSGLNASSDSTLPRTSNGRLALPKGFKVINFGQGVRSRNPLSGLLTGQSLRPSNNLTLRRTQYMANNSLNCMPSCMNDMQETMDGMVNTTEEIHNMLKELMPVTQETNVIVRATEGKLENMAATVNNKLDRLSTVIKSGGAFRPGSSVLNKVIHSIIFYYNVLFTVIRLLLELTWVLFRSGCQWGSACPFWGLCIPHIIVTWFSYIMFSVIIQGGVLLVMPVPRINLYPYIFNENMGLQILLFNFGVLLRSVGLGVWRVRAVVEPTNRATRSMMLGLLGLQNDESVLEVMAGYIRGPVNYVSENVIGRIVDGVRQYLPSSDSIPGSGIVSGAASSVAGAATSAASSVAGAATSAASTVAGAAAQYLPSTDSLKFWKGTGGMLLKDTPNSLEYNKLYPITNTIFDLTMFDKELNEITFLTKSEKISFNKSKTGQNLNKLKNVLDTLLNKQLKYIVQSKEVRVSMYLIVMEKFVKVIELGIPKFKKGFAHSMEMCKLLIKNDLKLINANVLFSELLNTDFIRPTIPHEILYNNKIKNTKSASINPLYISRFLKSPSRINKSLKKKK